MVASQLRTNAVTDTRLLAALERVPREDFLPADRRAAAYIDRGIPLGDGRMLNPPLTTALLLNAAAIEPGDRVLLVGDVTGYAAAVVTEMGGVVGDTDDGAAFDAIVIDGAVESVPDDLVARLSPAGRLTCALVENGVTRLAVGRKGGAGFGLVAFADAEAAVLPGFARPKEFVF